MGYRPRGQQAPNRERGKDQSAEPRLVTDYLEDNRRGDHPQKERQVRGHFQNAIAGRKLLVRQDLRQDPVLGRHEQGGLNSEQTEHSERQHPPLRLGDQRGGAGKHQYQFDGLHPQDHRALAHAVGQDAGW